MKLLVFNKWFHTAVPMAFQRNGMAVAPHHLDEVECPLPVRHDDKFPPTCGLTACDARQCSD